MYSLKNNVCTPHSHTFASIQLSDGTYTCALFIQASIAIATSRNEILTFYDFTITSITKCTHSPVNATSRNFNTTVVHCTLNCLVQHTFNIYGKISYAYHYIHTFLKNNTHLPIDRLQLNLTGLISDLFVTMSVTHIATGLYKPRTGCTGHTTTGYVAQ